MIIFCCFCKKKREISLPSYLSFSLFAHVVSPLWSDLVGSGHNDEKREKFQVMEAKRGQAAAGDSRRRRRLINFSFEMRDRRGEKEIITSFGLCHEEESRASLLMSTNVDDDDDDEHASYFEWGVGKVGTRGRNQKSFEAHSDDLLPCTLFLNPFRTWSGIFIIYSSHHRHHFWPRIERVSVDPFVNIRRTIPLFSYLSPPLDYIFYCVDCLFFCYLMNLMVMKERIALLSFYKKRSERNSIMSTWITMRGESSTILVLKNLILSPLPLLTSV